jgi:hypothetical protein
MAPARGRWRSARVLKNAQERRPRQEPELPGLLHENIRGPGYYH